MFARVVTCLFSVSDTLGIAAYSRKHLIVPHSMDKNVRLENVC